MNRKNEFGKGEPKLCGLDLKATSFQTLLYLTAPSVLKSCVNENTEQMESPLRGVGLQRFLFYGLLRQEFLVVFQLVDTNGRQLFV